MTLDDRSDTRVSAPYERAHGSQSQSRALRAQPHLNPGVEGNARLTALAGLLLLILLFVEGITVLNVRGWLSVHVFVGLMLIPPILLKTASTGYRFARYYLGNREYRAAGPPHPFLRVIAPIMLGCTIGLFGTGVALLVTGPDGGRTWRGLHQVFFFFWFWLMSAHVLAHTSRAARLGLADLARRSARNRTVSGAFTREGLVVGSACLGLVAALAFLPLDASWLHWASRIRFDG